jgi:pimeloyl-ACP methyl ester carboxylesterase
MGWMGVKEDWHPFAQACANTLGRRVLTFDNRGIGESTVAPGPYTMSQMADDAEAVARHAFPASPRVHVFGCSMGGMIAQHLALRHPARVASLTLGCTSGGKRHFVPHPTATNFLASLPAPGEANTPEAKRAVQRAMYVANFTPAWIAANAPVFDAIVDRAAQFKRSARGIFSQMVRVGRGAAAPP